MTPLPAPRGRALGAGLAATAAATWWAQRWLDRSRTRRDPAYPTLFGPPSAGRRIRVPARDGTLLHAEVFGREEAPTIVLVHGWTCTLDFWRFQIRELSDRYRVVAFDLRGHGRSPEPEDGDYSIDCLADDVEAVLDACVPAGEQVVLAGHSLGAMTIVAWAGADPDRVRRRAAAVALINAGVEDLVSEALVLPAPSGLDRVRKPFGRLLLSAPAPLPRRTTPVSRRVVRYVALAPAASPARVAFCERMILTTRRGARAGCGRELGRLALHDSLAGLAVPALVLAGRNDRLTPPAHAERLAAELPGPKEIVELPGVGHMAPVEAPSAVTGALASLAARHLPPGTRGRTRAPVGSAAG